MRMGLRWPRSTPGPTPMRGCTARASSTDGHSPPSLAATSVHFSFPLPFLFPILMLEPGAELVGEVVIPASGTAPTDAGLAPAISTTLHVLAPAAPAAPAPAAHHAPTLAPRPHTVHHWHWLLLLRTVLPLICLTGQSGHKRRSANSALLLPGV